MIKKIILLLLCCILLSGCSFLVGDEERRTEIIKDGLSEQGNLNSRSRKWTFLMYVAADNNLESAAMADLCEIESSLLNTKAVTVLSLVDRNPAYDTSNDNWSGTRLYKMNTNRKNSEKKLISEQLPCKELGLTLDYDIELDMSSDYVLSSMLSYMCKYYPSEHYGLIIWGHGTGWRSGETENEICKGIAYDETSKTYMTLKQCGTGLKNGLNGQKLDFLGFDTCFGAEMEVLYELQEYTKYFAGSEGLVLSSGWNYNQLFSDFQKEGSGSVSALNNAALNQFKKQYTYSARASFVVVDMEKVNQLFTAFDDFCLEVSNEITTREERDLIMSCLSGNTSSVEKYTYGTAGNDIYLDCESLVNELAELYINNEAIQMYKQRFLTVEKEAMIGAWAADRWKGGIGVYFTSFAEGNFLSVNLPPAYIKGKTDNQIKFVEDSVGYVPESNLGKGLLDKLFYCSFN